MKALKVAGLIILSLVLFLSLTVFGVAFTLDRTILDPGFVTSEVNRLEIASLANESMAQQAPEELPEGLRDALVSTLIRLEPRLKEEASAAIHSVYDYLLGKRDNPELASVLRSTFLSSDFISAVLDEMDISLLARTIFEEKLAEEMPLPEEMAPHLGTALEESLANQEPWIREQLREAAEPLADYLVGERESFSVTISVEPIIDDLKETMLEVILESPPPPLEGLPPDLIREGFNEFYAEFSEDLPTTIDIDETMIGQEAPSQIASLLADGEIVLSQAREYVGYFQLGYILIIVLMAILIAGIVLIYREVKGSTRTLGIVFLASGLVALVGVLIGKDVVRGQLVQTMHGAPAQLQVWIPQFAANLLVPLQLLSIGFIVGGIGLLVVSFVYGSRYATD